MDTKSCQFWQLNIPAAFQRGMGPVPNTIHPHT